MDARPLCRSRPGIHSIGELSRVTAGHINLIEFIPLEERVENEYQSETTRL